MLNEGTIEGIKNENPGKRTRGLTTWRTEGDSNPRYAMNVYTLSRRAPSTARPPVLLSLIGTGSLSCKNESLTDSGQWSRMARTSGQLIARCNVLKTGGCDASSGRSRVVVAFYDGGFYCGWLGADSDWGLFGLALGTLAAITHDPCGTDAICGL